MSSTVNNRRTVDMRMTVDLMRAVNERIIAFFAQLGPGQVKLQLTEMDLNWVVICVAAVCNAV